MNILFLWITTIIVSRGMNLITTFKIFKDIYGSGYKINIKKISELDDILNSDNVNKYRRYIMFLNIFDAFKFGMEYIKNPNDILNYFFMNDSIEEMDKEEIEMYNKKPNIVNALYISELSKEKEEKKEEEKIINRDSIILRFNNKGKTYFQIIYSNTENEKIKIKDINVRTDLLNNFYDDNYSTFVFEELKSIKKVSKFPIKKQRLIKYLRRLNRKESIDIFEEKVNMNDLNDMIKNNSKATRYSNLYISDVLFDGNKQELEEENLENNEVVRLEMRRGK